MSICFKETGKIMIQINQLYVRHFNGETITSLAKEVNMSAEWLREQFIKNNLPTISKMDIYERKNEEIIKLYSEGSSAHDIEKLLQIPCVQVWRILKNHNIDTKKSMFFYREKNRKYNIDENYFNAIDCPEKAYILGFLFADGNANKKFSQITLKLQERDKIILEKISLLIGSNKPLHFNSKQKNTHQNQYSLKITNKVMYLDLIRHGIVPNKTFIIKFPTIIDNLIPHFIRGYFDGDGCFYIDKFREYAEWSLMGTSSFCDNVGSILERDLGISYQINHDKRCKIGIDTLRIRPYNDIIKVCQYIYNNSTIHLERKYDKFQKLMDMKR